MLTLGTTIILQGALSVSTPNLQRFLFDYLAQVRSHIEFDLDLVCAVRHHDGRIADAASAKLHGLFCCDFAVLDQT